MAPTRRRSLQVLGGGATALLAGCSALDDRPGLDLRLVNYRDAALDVRVELLRPRAGTRDEAVAFDERVSLPGRTDEGDPGRWRAGDVATARAYRVAVHVIEVGRKSWHAHYVPDCVATGPFESAPAEPVVEVVLNDDPGVAFSQTRCEDGVATGPDAVTRPGA